MNAVLLGDPSKFHIRQGGNPHTRDRFGRRKRVDLPQAVAQWENLKTILESHGVRVHLVPAVEDQPGLVFPANAGFRHGEIFYLSNLNPGRAGEKEHYRSILTRLGFPVKDLPVSTPFEGEADFIEVGDPSGDPEKSVYLFTYGSVRKPGWLPRLGFPPYRRVYGFRSDRRAFSMLEGIVRPREVILLELIDEAHYHGDTALCSFGPRKEFLLVYLEALHPSSRAVLGGRFRDRLIPLKPPDGRAFAANSFQISTPYFGETRFVLLMPDGLTENLYTRVRSLGVIPCPVDVSEFMEKGGGAVKCMLLNLGEL